MEHKSLHGKIVREILPRFAEKLKNEKVISAYDCHPFTFSVVKGEPPIKIIPDLVIHLPNSEKVLIEIANPRDPKRFLGEMVCPQFLFYHKKIAKGIIFVLHDIEHQDIHDRGFNQNMMLGQIFRERKSVIMASWPRDDTTAYHNLKYILEHNPPAEWLDFKK